MTKIFIFILIFFGLGALLWFLLRSFLWKDFRKRDASLPHSAPTGNWTSRIAETIVLACAGTAIVVFTATNLSNGGLMLVLDKLRPEFAATNLIVAICAITGTLLALLICLFLRTSVGVILMTTVLCAYGWILNGPGHIIERIAPQDSYEPIVNYTFEVRDEASIQGADIWINNVYLGKTPVNTTRRQFHEKVPYLKQPPAGYADEQKRQLKDHWFRFTLLELSKRDKRYGTWPYDSDFKDYYVRIKLGDEWGERIHGGTGGGTSGYRRGDYSVSLNVDFPSRRKIIKEKQDRFETLLQKARLRDYRVESAWFKAMATYGEKGWMKLRKLSLKEREFSGVVDKWVEWKYGFTKDINQEKAKEVFQRICDEVDRDRLFRTSSPASLAIEMIYEKLDLESLVDRYESALCTYKKMTAGRSGSNVLGGLFVFNETRHSGTDVAPASTAAIAHVLRLYDAKFDAEDYESTNIIEERITPAIMLRFRNRHMQLNPAVEFGGPAIARFLLRQSWWAEPNHNNKDHLGGAMVNKWLFYLANLDDPAGRNFRLEHRNSVVKLANVFCKKIRHHHGQPPAFLLLDLDQGKKSLAYEYWPSYSAKVEISSASFAFAEKVKKRFIYLSKMEPVPTMQMYLDAWHETFIKPDSLSEGAGTAASIIPPTKRSGFLAILQKEITEQLEPLDRHDNDIRYLYNELIDAKRAVTEAWMNIGDIEALKTYVRQPQVVEFFVSHEESVLRMTAMEALRKYPTSPNRAILQKLLGDSDEQVRRAAEQLAAELKEIEETPVEEFVCHPVEK
ncbi:MAG: HEAT repeat domain-containing protein [Planctomycetota bacterium]|jgi:hypothetical protein